MSSSHSDDAYSNDLDYLVGAVEQLEDPHTIEQWNNSLFNQTIGPDLLPTHIPCLATLRVLKTCLRSSRGGIKSCVPQLSDLEKCSSSLYAHNLSFCALLTLNFGSLTCWLIHSFHEMQRKLPKNSCEKELAAYFSLDVSDTKSLKQAKHAWVDLFTCAKAVEAQTVYSYRPKSGSL